MSASELWGDEAECLSDGMARAPAKENGSQVDTFLCPTLTLYLVKHGEVGGEVPKGWADKARRAEMHSGGSDVLANDMTIHLHTSFMLALGEVPHGASENQLLPQSHAGCVMLR